MRHGHVDARGLTFDVTADGPRDGPAVLLLHGFPQNRSQWDLVAPALHAAGLRTYAVDQRGYSPGARPADVAAYALVECAADAAALLDSLDLSRVHVVGHDWGALVGWQLAAAYRNRVHTLTAVSVPHPAALAMALRQTFDQRRRSAYVALLRRAGVAERVLLPAGAAGLRTLLRGVPHDRVDRYVRPLRVGGALTAALNWYRALETTALAEVPAVGVPTTFVWSDRDPAIGRAAASACGRHVAGDYRFVTLRGVGHWVPDVAPEPLAAAVVARVAAGG